MFRIRCIVVLFAVICAVARGQEADKKKDAPPPPKLLVATPLTIPIGQPVKLTLRGQHLEGVTSLKFAGTEITAKLTTPPEKASPPNNAPVERLGDWHLVAEFELPEGHTKDRLDIAATSTSGESNSLTLPVADARHRIQEQEPNDGLKEAHEIAIPVIVEGVIEKPHDVDVFRFKGQLGETLTIRIEAGRYHSPLDAFLTVHDDQGRILASEDDTKGLPDPELSFKIPVSGTYSIAVMDAHDQGGPMYAYRLVVESSKGP